MLACKGPRFASGRGTGRARGRTRRVAGPAQEVAPPTPVLLPILRSLAHGPRFAMGMRHGPRAIALHQLPLHEQAGGTPPARLVRVSALAVICLRTRLGQRQAPGTRDQVPAAQAPGQGPGARGTLGFRV